MDIRILTPENNKLVDTIKESIKWSDTIYLAVAYGSYQAYKLLEDEFKHFLLEDEGKLRALFDIEKVITDYRVIENIATIPGNSECRVYVKEESNKSFHTKFYLFFNEDEDQFKAIIGSSNFTKGGLSNNIECNLAITGKLSEVVFEDLKNYFEEIWVEPYSLNVFNYPELLYKYRDVYNNRVKEVVEDDNIYDEYKKEVKISVDSKEDVEDISSHKELAFFLGILSGQSFITDDNSRLYIWARRGLQNKNTENEGYYVSPKGGYKISQKKAVKEDIERIKERILELDSLLNDNFEVSKIISDHTEERIRYYLYIDLPSNSKILNILEKCNVVMRDYNHYFDDIKAKQIKTFIPDEILESDNKNLIREFLSGYGELKARIALSDSTPKMVDGEYTINNLRVSYSIREKEIVDDFVKLFNKIGIENGLTPYKRSDRECMIRIEVKYLPAEIFLSPWRRRMVSEYQSYSYLKEHNEDQIDLFND